MSRTLLIAVLAPALVGAACGDERCGRHRQLRAIDPVFERYADRYFSDQIQALQHEG